LEQRPHLTDDPYIERALAMLSDVDLEVLQEAGELNETGYNAEEISFMMAERWLPYEAAAAHFQESYQRAVDALKPKEKKQAP
jgi:quinol monooxygenase YgiN